MKISHSAVERYKTCGESYRLHYIEKIRPIWTTSALLFGDAIDTAIRAAVMRTGSPYSEFMLKWTNGFINKQATYLSTSPLIKYSKKDFDAELLTEEDYASLDALIASRHLERYVYEELAEKREKSDWQAFSDSEKAFYNYMNWMCLKNKAKIMLQAHNDQILPKIGKVYGMQIGISSSNGIGDDFIGYVDMEAEYEGHDKPVIFDYKTTSSYYKWNAARESAQLATYVHHRGPEYNTKLGGFIVLSKQIKKIRHKTCQTCGNSGSSRANTCDAKIEKKRCHGIWTEKLSFEGKVQVIIQEIDTGFEEAVLDDIDNTANQIKEQVFEKNYDKCEKMYGDKCPYISLCHEKSMKGLVKNET